MESEPYLVGGFREIASNCDVLLCDVWGVVHNGVVHFPKTADALTRFRKGGGTVVLVTNAPRPRQRVAAFLDSLAVPRDSYDEIITAGDVTISSIIERRGLPLAHFGPANDVSLFAEADRLIGEPLRLTSVAEAAYLVCIGLNNPTTETVADYQKWLDLMVKRGMEFICANPDVVEERGDKLVACAGALAQAYAVLGGKVIQAGKPYAPIYERALALAEQLREERVDRSRIMAVGDSIDTDIKGAYDLGFATLFVTNGIHRTELHGAEGDKALDLVALRKFIEKAGFAPTASIDEFRW